jgi:hypothetical protein
MVKTKKRVNSKNKTRKISRKSDYVVAIPTYKRYDQVYEKSISTLIKHKVASSKIYLFVANKEEAEEYKKSLPKGSYHKIVIGVLGIQHQRNFIIDYFKEGTNVVFMDDDVERIDKLKGESFKQISDVDKFMKSAFKECREAGLYLWGIYPVRNEFFMKPRPEKSKDLRFIIGAFYGQVIRHSKDLKMKLKQKVDVENTILHYIKDGGVLRYEKVTIKTKYYNPKGGILAVMKTNRLKVNEESAKKLERLYPKYGHVWKRENGKFEFKLNVLPYTPK